MNNSKCKERNNNKHETNNTKHKKNQQIGSAKTNNTKCEEKHQQMQRRIIGNANRSDKKHKKKLKQNVEPKLEFGPLFILVLGFF
jgi:hypothetical protein